MGSGKIYIKIEIHHRKKYLHAGNKKQTYLLVSSNIHEY